ncbi:MAG: hypothetical protein GY801_07090, partial [bacterium]|nr:hypothetical protein [bacterium]
MIHDERILPVEEMVAYEEFTGRVEILRELDLWVKNIQRMGSMSTALISPRRMGKTVLLDRLVNTVFFKPEYRVAPFYLKIKREETTLHEFLLLYATTFYRQYIAYCHQDPILYQNTRMTLKDLLAFQSEHKVVHLAQEFIHDFLRRYAEHGYEDARNHWDDFIGIPEQLASFSGLRVAVIIDEFQDMKFYVHDIDKPTFERFKLERNGDLRGLYAGAQVNGHPYYLYCLAMSKCDGKSFSDITSIDRVIRYEIERGKIYGFWQTHFQDNRRYINADNDRELGKKIIYYFTQYNNQPVDIKAIAAKLGVNKEIVEDKIEKLYLADLVYRSAAKYYTFNDICLMRFIKFVYEQDLEGVDAIDLSRQNLFNTLKGKFLEMVVQVTMMKFNRERLNGADFGMSGEIEVPLFQVVKARTVNAANSKPCQIDVYGLEQGQD